jgi:hypothetical protein
METHYSNWLEITGIRLTSRAAEWIMKSHSGLWNGFRQLRIVAKQNNGRPRTEDLNYWLTSPNSIIAMPVLFEF